MALLASMIFTSMNYQNAWGAEGVLTGQKATFLDK